MDSHCYLLEHLNLLNAEPALPRRIQVALPDLNTDGRVCFYGYEISREWLIDYTNELLEDVEEFDSHAKVSVALSLLRSHSGIKNLEYEPALPDPKAATGTLTMAGYQGPTEKIDRLSKILGGKQPKWWVDAEDPRSY